MIATVDIGIPAAMTVAGSDSGGGAGIQADIFAFAANGVYACSAIAALTAQNPNGVAAVEEVSPQFMRAQLDCVQKYFRPAAAKTGMLFSADIVEIVADFFSVHTEIKLVVDPVMISTSGAKLLSDTAAEALVKKLVPLATVWTPNLDEASFLLGVKISRDNFCDCALKLREKFGADVLLKGGHLEGKILRDVLARKNLPLCVFDGERIDGVNTHGSGCTLSAAIAANLAKAVPIEQACRAAKAYIENGMRCSVRTAANNFINHFPQLKK